MKIITYMALSFYPDGSRLLNLFDTWQIATWEYISHGYFLKTPDGVTLFEESSDYYAEGKKVSYKQMEPDTTKTFCDVPLDAKSKIFGQIERWDHDEGRILVYLVFLMDDAEVSINLYEFRLCW